MIVIDLGFLLFIYIDFDWWPFKRADLNWGKKGILPLQNTLFGEKRVAICLCACANGLVSTGFLHIELSLFTLVLEAFLIALLATFFHLLKRAGLNYAMFVSIFIISTRNPTSMFFAYVQKCVNMSFQWKHLYFDKNISKSGVGHQWDTNPHKLEIITHAFTKIVRTPTDDSVRGKKRKGKSQQFWKCMISSVLRQK